MAKEFFIRLGEHLFRTDQTTTQLFGPYIFDQSAGREYQLIHSMDFFQCVVEADIQPSNAERAAIIAVLDSYMIPEVFLMSSLYEIMKNAGIEEDVPVPTKNFNYSELDGKSIRIINRIIKYLD